MRELIKDISFHSICCFRVTVGAHAVLRVHEGGPAAPAQYLLHLSQEGGVQNDVRAESRVQGLFVQMMKDTCYYLLFTMVYGTGVLASTLPSSMTEVMSMMP